MKLKVKCCHVLLIQYLESIFVAEILLIDY